MASRYARCVQLRPPQRGAQRVHTDRDRAAIIFRPISIKRSRAKGFNQRAMHETMTALFLIIWAFSRMRTGGTRRCLQLLRRHSRRGGVHASSYTRVGKAIAPMHLRGERREPSRLLDACQREPMDRSMMHTHKTPRRRTHTHTRRGATAAAAPGSMQLASRPPSCCRRGSSRSWQTVVVCGGGGVALCLRVEVI